MGHWQPEQILPNRLEMDVNSLVIGGCAHEAVYRLLRDIDPVAHRHLFPTQAIHLASALRGSIWRILVTQALPDCPRREKLGNADRNDR